MENKVLKNILEQLNNRVISVNKAYELISVLYKDDKPIDSGDFRDPTNYESQDEYFGRK